MSPSTSGRLEVLDAYSSDEEIMMFLRGRKVGDSVPVNVITKVNPFSIEPWDLSENIWYLYNAEDSQSSFIKLADIGYWRPMSDLTLATSTPSVRQKTTLEFFLGKEPFGDRTGWVMHEYQAEDKPHLGTNEDYTSLCRVFWQNESQANTNEQDTPVTVDVEVDKNIGSKMLSLLEQKELNQSENHANRFEDYTSLCRVFWQNESQANTNEQDTPVTADVEVDKNIGSKMLSLLEQKELNQSENHANRFEASVGDGHRRPSSTERSSQNLVSHKSIEDMAATNDFSEEGYLELKNVNMHTSAPNPDDFAAYDFSKGDYLELNDLYDSETSSSSSDNFSFMSGNLDECFDPDALLRDISCESDPNLNEEHVDCKFSISASVKPDHVVIDPPPRDFSVESYFLAGFTHSIDWDPVVEEAVLVDSIPETRENLGPVILASAAEIIHNENVSPSSTPEGRQRYQSQDSPDVRSPRGPRSRSTGRIAKLRKKYLCFGPF